MSAPEWNHYDVCRAVFLVRLASCHPNYHTRHQQHIRSCRPSVLMNPLPVEMATGEMPLQINAWFAAIPDLLLIETQVSKISAHLRSTSNHASETFAVSHLLRVLPASVIGAQSFAHPSARECRSLASWRHAGAFSCASVMAPLDSHKYSHEPLGLSS